MTKRLFLSHDSRDSKLAKIVADVLKRITLAQLDVWYSSDPSSEGGFKPGHVWIDEIRSRLGSCDAVVALLTRRSVQKPWLLFECGFGASDTKKEVIPVAVGIDTLSSIPFPLGMYQCYQLADYDSLKTFAAKILTVYGIIFDEELAGPLLKTAIGEITRNARFGDNSVQREPRTLDEVERSLKTHIDRRLSEMFDASKSDVSNFAAAYSVPIHIKIPGLETTHFVEIEPETSVQDILDNVYFMLSPSVASLTYLSKWVLHEPKLHKHLIMREISELIPARYLFTRELNWEVLKLEKPWTPKAGVSQRLFGRANR